MRFLVESHRHFNHMTATLIQGLQHLGHVCFGADGNWNNYLIPHEGQETDAFIQTTDNPRLRNSRINILVIGADSGHSDSAHVYGEKAFPDFNAVFVRDLRHSMARHIFPINFGIEDRYYCITSKGRKKLVDREFDVTFLGGFDYNPERKIFVDSIKDEFGNKLNLKLDGKIYNEPDGYWSKWLNAHCTHSREYFEILANSKIVFSPWGLGPDCARHWEAMASGGIPLIQRMPTFMCPPGFRDCIDSVSFHHTHDLRHLIYSITENLDHYQKIADSAWEEGKLQHTTKARALYFMDMLKGVLDHEAFGYLMQQQDQSKESNRDSEPVVGGGQNSIDSDPDPHEHQRNLQDGVRIPSWSNPDRS